MKKKIYALLTAVALIGASGAVIAPRIKEGVGFATYTNGDAATYYNSIDETQSGNTLLTALRTLNLSKRKSTVGYDSMGTTPSGQFKYTDYDTSSVQYDSNGQPYGTKISSFYTYTSATSWNREHVWPKSHGGGSGGDAGSPYPDADIHMPRPTISSENSSRGNSFFVEGMSHSSNGWDPYTAGYSENSRGEAARITFYCTLVNSKLILAPNNTTPSGTDSVTGQSYGSGHTMGNLETLIKWNINYPVTQREKNRNEGAEYLQGNRNAFVDHPEYACKIWGNVNSTIKNLCANASWDSGPSVSISRSTASMVVDDTTMISATASDSSTISWTSSDTTVVTVSSASSSSGSNITLTAIGPGTATITARATIESTVYSATCKVTVSSSGSGGGEESGDYTVSTTALTSSGITNGMKVVWGTSPTMIATGIDSNWVRLSSTSSDWKVFTLTGTSSGFTLSTSDGNVYSSATKKVEFSTTQSTTMTLDNNGRVVGSSIGTYYYNGSGLRPYNSGSYTNAYLYPVTYPQEKTLSSISVATAPTKTTYTAGETFDPTGLVITRNYSDSTSDTYTYANHTSEFTFSPSTSTALTTSNASVTITYSGKSTSQAITVNAAATTLSSISISGQTTSFTVDDTFSFGGTVTAHFSDSSSSDVTASATFSGYNMSVAGNYTVTVSYTYGGTTKTATYSITVSSSGGSGGGTETGSQRISASTSSTYYQSGDICPTGSTSSATATCDAFDVSWLKNSGNNIVYTYAEIRVYTGHSYTITPKEGYTITSVVITANNSTYANSVGGSKLTNCTKDVSSSTVTLTPTDGTSAVGFTNSAQTRLNYIVVNYEYESDDPVSSTLSSISVSTAPTKTTYTAGEYFDPTGLVINRNYSNSTSDTYTYANHTSEFTFSPTTSTALTTSNVSVTITYGGKSTSQAISVSSAAVTSITASVSKTYYVGETISASDITVVDNNGDEIDSFTFANDGYQFTYADAASGGAVTDKTFTNAISGANLTCSLTVQVQRKARETPSGSQSDSVTYTDLPTTYQTSTTERTAASGIKFIAYNLANYSSKMQFKASGGYFQTTEALALKSLTINNRETNALTVCGSTNGTSFSTTISGTNDVYDLTGYSYVKVMKNGSGAAYCASLTIAVEASDTAANLSNYIMYEDTTDQCNTKLDIAIGYLGDLSSSERTTMQTSSDYVIATARERLEAWAAYKGKTINYSNGELQRAISTLPVEANDSKTAIIVIVVTLISVTSIGGYFYLRKRKYN